MKKSSLIILIVLIVLIVLTLAGCFSEKKESEKKEIETDKEIVINKSVKVLEEKNFDDFVELEIKNNAGKIKILKEYSKKFSKDDILTRGISKKFPFGLMVKIVKIEEEEKYDIYTVIPAAISEIIEKGDINFEQELTGAEIANKEFNYSGVTLETISEESKSSKRGSGTSEVKYSMVLGFNDVVLNDADGNSDTTDDRLIINGNLKVKPKARLELKFNSDDIGVKTKAGFYVENNLQGELSLKGNYDNNWEKEVSIGKIYFNPIAIIVYCVPFVFIPSVEFVVGTDGKIKSNLIFSATETIYTKVWADYEYRRSFTDITAGINEYGNWNADMKQESEFKFQEPKFSSTAIAKIYTGVKGKIAVDGVVDFYGQVNVYLRGEADIEKNPWWNLYAGVDGEAGASSFKSLPSFKKEFNFYESKILSADGAYNKDEDENVDLGWAKMYRKNNINEVENSFQINKTVDFEDGSIVSIGVNKKGPYNGFVMKTDSKGKILWKKSFEKEIRDIAKTDNNRIAVIAHGGEVDAINKEETMVLCEIDADGKEVYKKLLYNNNRNSFIVTEETSMIYNKKTGEVILTGKSTIEKYTDSFFIIALKNGIVTKVKKINSLMTPDTISVAGFYLNGMDISQTGEIVMAFHYGCRDNKTGKNTGNDGVILVKLNENLEVIWKKDIAMESEVDPEIYKVLFGITFDILDVKFDKTGNIYFVTSRMLWHEQDVTGVFLTKIDSDGKEIYTSLFSKKIKAGFYFDNDDFTEAISFGTGLKLAPLSNGEIAMAGNPGKSDKAGLKGSEFFRFDTVGNMVYYRNIGVGDKHFLITDIHEDVKQKGIYISGSTNGFNSYASYTDRLQYSREPFLIYSNLDLNISSAVSKGEIEIKAVSSEVYKGKLRDRKDFSPDEELLLTFDNYDTLIIKDDWREVMFKEFEELTVIKM